MWLPSAAFLLLSMCLRSSQSNYLFQVLFTGPWESNFALKLGFCLGLSLLAWLLCRKARSRPIRSEKAFGSLAVFFLICAMAAGLCRNFNIPYRFMVENNTNYRKRIWNTPITAALIMVLPGVSSCTRG